MKNRTVNQLTTSHLKLHPLADEELRALIAATEDDGLKTAYSGMLEASLADPANRLWIVPWAVNMKKGNVTVGHIGFHGSARDDAVEIGYGIDDAYRNRGYATEAAKALIHWAFQSDDVFFIEAESEAGNAASLRVLEKLKFTNYMDGEEGPRFYLAKPASNYSGVYTGFGIVIGMVLGSMQPERFYTCLCVGFVLGVGIGSYKDKKAKEQRNAAWIRRNNRLGKQ